METLETAKEIFPPLTSLVSYFVTVTIRQVNPDETFSESLSGKGLDDDKVKLVFNRLLYKKT